MMNQINYDDYLILRLHMHYFMKLKKLNQYPELLIFIVANKNSLSVALDVKITPELEQEGNAREFVNRIQKIRKDSGFELTDRILVKVAAVNSIKESLAKYNNYICAEILADKLEIMPELKDRTDPAAIGIEVNDVFLKVIISKKG